MSNHYSADEFRKVLLRRLNQKIPPCPFCGESSFSTNGDFVSLLSQKEFGTIQIGAHIPVGIVVCNNCGHIEQFALGALGLLNKAQEEVNNSGTKEE